MHKQCAPGLARRRISDSELEIAVEDLVCPLRTDEVAEWTMQLGGIGPERRLKDLVTYWFDQARSFLQAIPATDIARRLQYIKDRKNQGYTPEAAMKVLPEHFDRIDKWLPD